MASNRGKLSGLDWQDVNQALVNLQAVIGGTIKMEMAPELRNGQWDLILKATRERPLMGAMDQPPLVCVNASCRVMRFVELEAAALQVLHMLDLACFAQGAYQTNEMKA